MRSFTPCLCPWGLRGSETSSQFLKAARWSSPQNLERAFSSGKPVMVSAKPRASQSSDAAREVLVDVVAERHGEFLLLHGGEVEVRGLLDPALAHGEHVVDGLHVARTEDDARRELGGHDGFGEFGEERPALGREPEHDVRHEDGDEPGERAAEIRLHRLDLGVARPERVGGFQQLGAELSGLKPPLSPSPAAFTMGSSDFEPLG